MSRVRFALVNLLAATTLILLILHLAGGFRPTHRDFTGIHGTITMGWGATYPYQYEQGDGQHRLAGLDTELLRAAFLESGYRVNFVDKSWNNSLLLLFLIFRSLELLPPRYSERLERVDLEHNWLLVLFDSLGLGAFTVLGVLVALQYRCEPLWLWGPLLAVVTNGGGSVIRDLITMRPVSIVTTTIPYVEISAVWGLVLSAYLIYSSGHLPYRVVELQLALLGTTLGVILTRYVILRWKVQTPCLGGPGTFDSPRPKE